MQANSNYSSPNVKSLVGDYSTLDLAGVFQSLCLYLKPAGEPGKHFVTCPWECEHGKTGRTDTVVWQGEGWPTFHCSHAHCAGRDVKAVMEWANGQRAGIIDDHCSRSLTGFRYQRADPAQAKPKLKAYHPTGERTSLPEPMEYTPAQFLQAVFQPDDFITINHPTWSDQAGKLIPATTTAGAVLVSVADELMASHPINADGFYYRINPVKPPVLDLSKVRWDGAAPPADAEFICHHVAPGCGKLVGDKDEAISDFRHLLVELETDKKERAEMSSEEKEDRLAEYYHALINSGLPLAAIYTSGDVSVHGLVRIDAGNQQEWKERQVMVYDFAATMPGFDKNNKNPSRYSRLPGAYRGENLQALLYLRTNAQWSDWQPAIDDPLGEDFTAATVSFDCLRSMEIIPRKKLLGEWLREGDLGFVYGARGSGKTWLIDFLVSALTSGRPIVESWDVHEALKVLLVDGEMPIDDFRGRLQAFGAGERLLTLHHEYLFQQSGRSLNLTDAGQQQRITALCEAKNVKLVVLDNLSCLFSGLKENDNDEWEKVLNWLLELRRRRIAVVIVHHAGRNGLMRGASRREDAAFWVIKVEEIAKRSRDEIGARFHTEFEKQRNNASPEWGREWSCIMDESGKLTVSCNELAFDEKVLRKIQDGLTSATDIAEELKCAKSTISKAFKRLLDAKLIEVSGNGNRSQYRPRGHMKE